MNLVVTGGGTGGHIFGGVAIAREFLSQSHANKALFVGSDEGLEVRLVPKAGLPLETLHLGKLVGQSKIRKLLTLIQIPIAIVKCVFILKKFKADFVVGVGGFAAGPCIIAARILGIPSGVLEQNSVMGFTNRLSAKVATHVFTAFDEIPVGVSASKCTFTGNPARGELKPNASAHVKNPFTVFVFGGSQGALGLNRMVTEAAASLIEKQNEFHFIHQTGDRDFDWVKKKYEDLGWKNVEVTKFIDDMQSMYSRASLLVCRAGSGTIAELGATKSAAIFIPFPQAAQNHQVHNAMLIEAAGAGIMLEQARNGVDTPGTELANLIEDLKKNSEKIEKMRENITAFYKPDAAKRIVDIMKIHAMKRK